jgi:hypothetical protein
VLDAGDVWSFAAVRTTVASGGDTVTTYGLPAGTRLGPEWTVPPGPLTAAETS